MYIEHSDSDGWTGKTWTRKSRIRSKRKIAGGKTILPEKGGSPRVTGRKKTVWGELKDANEKKKYVGTR